MLGSPLEPRAPPGKERTLYTTDFDPFSSAVRDDPYPHFAALREAAPVARLSCMGGGVAITRYDDVLFVLKNPALFSSARKKEFAARMNLAVNEELLRMMRSQLLTASDPPVHTRLRGLVSGAFTPRRIAQTEPRIRAIARELVDAILLKGEFDLIEDLAVPLPVRVIAELLGVEPERRHDFKRWSDAVVSGVTRARGGGELAGLEAEIRELRVYLEGVVAARREEPRDDLISALVQSGEQGGVINSEEVVSFANLLLIAGNETTTNLIGTGVRALLENPGEWQKLLRTPSLIPHAVEEMLRYEPAAQVVFRVTTQEVQVGGETLPAGESVFAMLASANRDPRKYPDPERFDVSRDATGHVAFGHGIHFCLGAPLARLEAKVVFEELVSRMPGLAWPSGRPERFEWGQNLALRGLRSLRLRCGAPPAAARPAVRAGPAR